MMKSIQAKYRDPLRRFTATPFAAELRVMGRTVRIETSSATVFRRTVTLFERYQGSPHRTGRQPRGRHFLWRIVGEANSGLTPPWPEMTAFSDDGLRYVNLGHRSFFAVDLGAREAVAFLSEELASDKLGFASVFAATLFDLTAGALGLIQVAAACVALDGKALLILGPPNSGKTTSTYLAGKLGLEFYADQVTFLELEHDSLLAWGQFWPAAFRPDAIQFLPELRSSAHSFTYGSLTFWCFEEHPHQPIQARSVVPVGCVFLERGSAQAPRLTRLDPAELASRLANGMSFRDDERFGALHARAVTALSKLPAFRLAYGSDPAEAAAFFPSLLTSAAPEGTA
jgi:hypothetical protein